MEIWFLINFNSSYESIYLLISVCHSSSKTKHLRPWDFGPPFYQYIFRHLSVFNFPSTRRFLPWSLLKLSSSIGLLPLFLTSFSSTISMKPTVLCVSSPEHMAKTLQIFLSAIQRHLTTMICYLRGSLVLWFPLSLIVIASLSLTTHQ